MTGMERLEPPKIVLPPAQEEAIKRMVAICDAYDRTMREDLERFGAAVGRAFRAAQ
jgi:hypothetical protein